MYQLNIQLTRKSMTVAVSEIIGIEASSNYSRVYFSNGKKLLVSKILYWFEERLPAEMFAWVHRSHLINTGFITEINENKSCSLLLNNGDSIDLSGRKKSEYIKYYRQVRLV